MSIDTEETQQRNKLHISISNAALKTLEKTRKEEGFSAISQAIEYLCMDKRIAGRIDLLISAIESQQGHRRDTPGGNNAHNAGNGKLDNIPGVFKASTLIERKIVNDEVI